MKDEDAAMPSKDETAGVTQSSHVPAGNPRRLRVLIVEDDPIIAMELEMLFEELDAEVTGIAISAVEAVGHVQAQIPDFLTMDINIKGECDGVTLAQEILDEFGVRSIFVSAHADDVTRERAAPCKQIGWIVKPVSKSDLAQLLTRVTRLDG